MKKAYDGDAADVGRVEINDKETDTIKRSNKDIGIRRHGAWESLSNVSKSLKNKKIKNLGHKRMDKERHFEDLWIWQEARSLTKEIYGDFNQGSWARDYGFREQVQKAGVSIMNNIAEGFERNTDADFARFLDISKGYCGEVRSMYYAAEDLLYIEPEIAETRRCAAKRIAGSLASLIGHLRKK